ncbi:MAG: NAD(+) synthase [Muribaculaceae bacterium]|nr:NAD(+) synthase [Muribaculaceae bacterium]
MKKGEFRYCGLCRIAAAIPFVALGDVLSNTNNIIDIINHNRDCDVILFPELSVTGYTLGDLVLQSLLLDKAVDGLQQIKLASADSDAIIAVGAPIRKNNKIYNSAVLFHNGKILGVVPKSYIPNYSEFYERRWFEPGINVKNQSVCIGDDEVPFGSDLIFECGAMKIGVEICEDLWVTIPPSSHLAMAGANIILNLSASNHTIGKQAYRRSLISQQSARCRCVYAYSSAGRGESSTDLAIPGYSAIAENGSILIASEDFPLDQTVVTRNVDLQKIEADRIHYNTFNDFSSDEGFRFISVNYKNRKAENHDDSVSVDINPHPFVPSDPGHRNENCSEIIAIQCHALAQRLKTIHCDKLVIGVSGGLDSTLALLVACRTFDMMGISRKGIHGITMPGLATTSKTRNNAWQLMKLLGITSIEIPIGKAVEQHFKDIDQDPDTHDATYENSQARERTQIIMDYSNKIGGIVLGTGDLSELALGWCTYNGDQMSMYGINASIPKTLIRYLVEWFADRTPNEKERDVLIDIVNTPISPELVPAKDGDDSIAQKTEDLVGPYELHDFYLYHVLRYGASPKKIYFLAKEAFKDKYDEAVIHKWLINFYRRFFSQQFKRSCMPDGPKVGSVCLSPRGDWRMPSDASAAMWLRELDDIDPMSKEK